MSSKTQRDSNEHRIPPNKNPNQPDFIHLRYQDSTGKLSGQGGITIGYRAIPNSKDKFEIAVARCCPRDNFNRKVGRSISTGFLNFNNLYVISIANKNNYENTDREQRKKRYEEIRAAVVLFVVRKFNLPNPTTAVIPKTEDGQTLH